MFLCQKAVNFVSDIIHLSAITAVRSTNMPNFLAVLELLGWEGKEKKKNNKQNKRLPKKQDRLLLQASYWGFSSLLSQICSFLCFCTAMSADNNTKCYMCIDLTPGFLSHKSHPLHSPPRPPQKKKKTKKTRMLFIWIIDLFYVCFVFWLFSLLLFPICGSFYWFFPINRCFD